jgi:hypothetical protein
MTTNTQYSTQYAGTSKKYFRTRPVNIALSLVSWLSKTVILLKPQVRQDKPAWILPYAGIGLLLMVIVNRAGLFYPVPLQEQTSEQPLAARYFNIAPDHIKPIMSNTPIPNVEGSAVAANKALQWSDSLQDSAGRQANALIQTIQKTHEPIKTPSKIAHASNKAEPLHRPLNRMSAGHHAS